MEALNRDLMFIGTVYKNKTVTKKQIKRRGAFENY